VFFSPSSVREPTALWLRNSGSNGGFSLLRSSRSPRAVPEISKARLEHGRAADSFHPL
jgi:hypothetical protein